MDERQRDRRRIPSDFRTRPRSSPINLLIFLVGGVLVVTAAAAALFGTGLEETTPHGQTLTSLQRVADAQEDHYRRTGTFAQWLHSLDLKPIGEVRVEVVRGDRNGWEAMAIHPVGLTCIQTGGVARDQARRDQPLCYTDGID